jgi:energy-coupling factor transporter ATP-binding protein EcfA2
MTLTRIKLDHFTAFEELDLPLSPGINVFIGENGTGKTHLLKAAYAACVVQREEDDFAQLLIDYFMPYKGRLGRLVHRVGEGRRCSIEVHRSELKLRASFSHRTTTSRSATVQGRRGWIASPLKATYVPAKEVLSNAPGFRSLYAERSVHFEKIYLDIIDRALLPALRGAPDRVRGRLLTALRRAIEGRVIWKQETFFLKNKQGELEFMLLSEGMRKLALPWLLIQNGTLMEGAVLFWDEPEANLNPKKIGPLVEVLLELRRLGVQILLATHDYVLLKEFALRARRDDRVRYHALFRSPSGRLRHGATEEFSQIDPNAISDSFADLYDRDTVRALNAARSR